MSYIEGILLGFIQAVTEFLPISSSGHLVLAQKVLQIESTDLVLEIILHLGTLFSIIIFFRSDLKDIVTKSIIKKDRSSQKLIVKVLIATIPASIIGILFKESLVVAFNSLYYVSIAFMVTGFILFSTKFSKNKINDISFMIALIIGFSQILALLPGISRSGITIATALLLGVKSEDAARFSFFMAIPVLAGAGLLQINDLMIIGAYSILQILLGFMSSLFFGLIAIKILFRIVYNNYFWIFSFYCWFISIVTFFIRDI